MSVFLFTILDLIGKSNRYFTAHEPQVFRLIEYYIYQSPFQVVQSLPIASLIAAVVTMIGLSRANESTAVFAAGANPLRLMRAFIFCSFVVSIFALLGNEYIIPKTAGKMHYVKEVKIEKKTGNQLVDGLRWVREGNFFFSFVDYDAKSQTLRNVQAIELAKSNFRMIRKWSAESALYQESNGNWLLKGISITRMNEMGQVAEVLGREYISFPLPFKPFQLVKDRRDINEYSFLELYQMIAVAETSGGVSTPLKVAFHVKFAYAFASLVMVFMALPFSHLSERRTEIAKSVMAVFSIAFSYWFVLAASRALANSNTIPPFLGGWSANFLLMIVGLIFYKRTSRFP